MRYKDVVVVTAAAVAAVIVASLKAAELSTLGSSVPSLYKYRFPQNCCRVPSSEFATVRNDCTDLPLMSENAGHSMRWSRHFIRLKAMPAQGFCWGFLCFKFLLTLAHPIQNWKIIKIWIFMEKSLTV